MRGVQFHGEGAHTTECILVSAVTLTEYPAPPRTRMQNKAQIAHCTISPLSFGQFSKDVKNAKSPRFLLLLI